ncbi:hypothetical protein LQZ21_04275 [Treponema sp. TIM-1]|uniref:hypothetical protein n=1 Tax=Treponema sp. TIM-1 TaxID=2898417 RepID=UPI00397FCA6F
MNKVFEEVLRESRLSEMSKEERRDVMKAMSDNFDAQDEPKVGIFWYDKETDELFGVSKVNADDLQFNSNGIKTISALHQSWWQKQKNRAISKGKAPGIFAKDYTLIPRGRIFQQKDGSFQLMCGSWINESVIELVKDEFDLNNVEFEVKIDPHWEIGHGWSEEYEL